MVSTIPTVGSDLSKGMEAHEENMEPEFEADIEQFSADKIDGSLLTWNGTSDPENPRNWTSTKSMLTFSRRNNANTPA